MKLMNEPDTLLPENVTETGLRTTSRNVDFKGEALSVPDAFWDSDRDQPNVGALVKSHADLRRKLSERGAKVPESYELFVPEDLVDLIKADAEDPLAIGAMDWARKHGLSQEAFSELSSLYYSQMQGVSGPDQGVEMEKLQTLFGPRLSVELDQLTQWADGMLGEDMARAPELYHAFERMTSTAEGILLLKTLKDRLGERGVPSFRGHGGARLDASALRALQASEAYVSGDEATRRKVAEGWARLFPDVEE